MSDAQEPNRAQEPREPAHEQGKREGARAAEFFTRTALRIGLALVGFVLLVFALDQAFDLELLSALQEFMASSTGRWLFVAFIALLMMLVALRGWRTYSRPPR